MPHSRVHILWFHWINVIVQIKLNVQNHVSAQRPIETLYWTNFDNFSGSVLSNVNIKYICNANALWKNLPSTPDTPTLFLVKCDTWMIWFGQFSVSHFLWQLNWVVECCKYSFLNENLVCVRVCCKWIWIPDYSCCCLSWFTNVFFR